MKSTTKTLTEGPLAKQILLVSLPLALSNLLQVLYFVHCYKQSMALFKEPQAA